MSKLAAVIIDTYPNKHLAAVAIHMALRLPNVEKIYTFSDAPFFDGATFIEVPKLSSNNDYGSIVFNEIPKHVTEDHFFIIQWDGFPLFPQNWDDEFLKYDYIGAPLHGVWVGNGGFSVRSKKLIQTIASLGIGVDPSNPNDQPEDEIICTKYRDQLEAEGIKFAPVNVAEKFSFQGGDLSTPTLGFHSADNLPFFIPESELIKFSDQIVERIFQPVMMLRYLQTCMNVGYRELFTATVLNYEKKPNLLKAVQYEMSNNPSSPLMDLLDHVNT